jgi:glycopeptide antibiotics resistance protein
LLYIPLGLFLCLAIVHRKSRFISPWLLVGPLVSLTMEIGQMFIGRFPDVVDLVTNSFGYVIGYWVVVAAVRSYGLSPSVLLGINAEEEQDAKTQSIAAFRFIYVCIYSLIALLPFDVSVSLTNIYAQLFPNDQGTTRIILDPLYHFSRWEDSGIKLTLELLGLVPVAALTGLLGAIRGRPSVFAAINASVFLVAFCEVAQVFLLSRTTDIIMIPVAIIAGILGWALARVWFGLQDIEESRHAVERQSAWRPLVAALIGYALVITFFAWSPFRFELDPVTVAKKIVYESNLIPFKEHFSTRSLGSAIDIVKEVGLFIPFGVLFGYLLFEVLPGLSRGKVVLLSSLVSMGFATFTELSQAVCIGRYIDITDIFLAGAGGLSGAVLLRLFRFGKSAQASSRAGARA